ncbi:conserved hypothetical protein [Echinococcus multilocularis]|uniref:Uncharacterized protein n=1 Tax=Echinococcus multilocularis TaxID=6211 RepID=A0A068Y3A9_ECHMU|nr:conserved hypothetical protein [Echinococcus multilocularis]
MEDPPLCQYPWQVKQVEAQLDRQVSEPTMEVEAATESASVQPETPVEKPLDDATVPTEESSDSASNDDLEVLERSLIAMERYIEELQFEMLRLRQEDEAKRLKMGQPPVPFAEVVADLERMLTSLEAHKVDYSVMVEVQAENVRLQEEVAQLSEETQFLRRELETVRKAHAAELETINLANEEKLVAMRNEYEDKLTEQSKELTEMMDKEQANFAAQRDAWNEERASLLIDHANELASMFKSKEQKMTEEEPDFRTEILRQINEVQNQAREQVAQLQSRIEQLLTASTMVKTPTRTSRERARGNSGKTPIATPTPPPQLQWPLQQQEAENVLHKSPQRVPRKMSAHWNHQAAGSFTRILAQSEEVFRNPGSGQKRGYGETVQVPPPKPPVGAAAQLPARKSLKVAAVPPVLVMAEEPHPLLGSPANLKGKAGECLELPHSKWGKATDLLNQRPFEASFFQLAANNCRILPLADAPNANFMTSDDWFDYRDEQSQNRIQVEVADVSQALPPPLPSISPMPLQQQQQVGFGEKRRHLFTVHSGSN